MNVRSLKSFTKTSSPSKVILLFQNIFQFTQAFDGDEIAQAYLSKIMQKFLKENSEKVLFRYKCDDEEFHQAEFRNEIRGRQKKKKKKRCL